MQIDRADMKLLIEAGYSGVMRGVATDMSPVFAAITEWMPEYAAGPIGTALIRMVSGDLPGADDLLGRIIASDLEGRNEATAILAMCRVLQNQHEDARRLAAGLQGTGGHAEAFADGLVNGEQDLTQGHDGLAAEAGAAPARPVMNG